MYLKFLKIQNTCSKKHLNANTKYTEINAFKYKYTIQYFVFQIRVCILNYKYIPSLSEIQILFAIKPQWCKKKKILKVHL